jgi:hypothetical protein
MMGMMMMMMMVVMTLRKARRMQMFNSFAGSKAAFTQISRFLRPPFREIGYFYKILLYRWMLSPQTT